MYKNFKEIANSKDLAEDAYNSLASLPERGTGKALVALTMAIAENSEKSNKSANSMIILTIALVFWGSVQAVVTFLDYKLQQDSMRIRKDCFQTVLQTSDIDLNYKNCLRNNGLNE